MAPTDTKQSIDKGKIKGALAAIGMTPLQAIPSAPTPGHLATYMQLYREAEAAKAPPMPAEMTPEQWAALVEYLEDGEAHQDAQIAIGDVLAAANEGRQADFWAGLLILAKVIVRLCPVIKK